MAFRKSVIYNSGMNVKSFLKLVEIQTKVASITPFLLGTLYVLYRFDSFKPKNFLLMLASLLCIDMATTAINNYLDFKRANKKYGYGYESHNAIVRYNLRESTVLATISILLATAVITGLFLFLNTNIVVLGLGAVSFIIGISYSFGPVPISRTPFGEVFSGIFMGLVIPFIAAYIHVYDQNLLNIAIHGGVLDIKANLPEILYLILFSIPAAAGIANIMLANNICDIEDDIENKRYTLPVYIGKSRSLKVYEILYYTGYLSLIILLIIGVAPIVSVIALATLIPVYRHIGIFRKEQSKSSTFALAVKNFVFVNGVLVFTIAAAAAFRHFS
jgi:1,4-dihydroxy-2-naphthoate polyprenyltransferase